MAFDITVITKNLEPPHIFLKNLRILQYIRTSHLEKDKCIYKESRNTLNKAQIL